MSESNSAQAPTWFMIVAVLALIWNIFGVMAYIGEVTMTAEDMAALPEAQRALMENTPSWARAAFALAVHAGTLGALLLVLKKKWAVPLFGLSLLGVVVQSIHGWFMTNTMEVMGAGGLVLGLAILVIAIYLLWLSRSAAAKGWIN